MSVRRNLKHAEVTMIRQAWVSVALLLLMGWTTGAQEKPWERGKREVQDKIGGVPPAILAQQSLEAVSIPPIDEAIAAALKTADAAVKGLIDTSYHRGKPHLVPDQYASIQAAIDAAEPGDQVVVKAGTYFELLDLKEGVKLVSDSADGGDEFVPVAGATLQLPRRALRTILDGSKSRPSSRGMVNFGPGVSRKTIVDGFTIQNLPDQDHHIPGHAHGINLRGASAVLMYCYVRENGSTAIGNHVVYRDHKAPMAQRDFRRANILHKSEAVIYRNIVSDSHGLGIGCNHFSAPHILGNEIFGNEEHGSEQLTPGIGSMHGASPVILGNIVHDNEGGGILCMTGDPQGAHPIDGPTHPTIEANVVYSNGGDKRPQIGSTSAGSLEYPVRVIGNYVYQSGVVGMGFQAGAVVMVEGNRVSGAARPGISINGSTALTLNNNQVTGADAPGFVIISGASVKQMQGNAASGNKGPRFMLRDSTIDQ
jgi:parallel beta-helix repeat protein